MLISVIIPCFNERESLAELCRELTELSQTKSAFDFEFIFVDDGSTDGSAELLEEIAGGRFRVLRLPQHQGKGPAYVLGFSAAAGDTFVTLDSDLQDDPAELPLLLKTFTRGYDLVVGCKRNRFQNEPLRAIASLLFNAGVALLFGVRFKDGNSGFRVLSPSLARSLPLSGTFYRFIPLCASVGGYSVAEVPVVHRRRKYGRSHFGSKRIFEAARDLIELRWRADELVKRRPPVSGVSGALS